MQGSFRHRSGSGSGQTGKNISPKIKVCSCGTLHVQWVALDVELGGGINYIESKGAYMKSSVDGLTGRSRRIRWFRIGAIAVAGGTLGGRRGLVWSRSGTRLE